MSAHFDKLSELHSALSLRLLSLSKYRNARNNFKKYAFRKSSTHSNIREIELPFLLIKYLTTAAVVILVSELAKRSDKMGALIASLPMVTFLVLFWLYFEKQPDSKIANHAYYTFWYVIPTLPMFLAFPSLFQRFGFWAAIGLSVVITIICFVVFAFVVRRFGIELL